MSERYEIWVVSDKSGEWELYTTKPFASERQAQAWAKRYIPNANFAVALVPFTHTEESV
jgi:hypothetical protein